MSSVALFDPRRAPVTTPPVTRRAPASSGQASLWFLRQVMPCRTPYNTAVQLRLAGELDAGALVAAVREVVRRHESFRTTFTVADGTVLQVIADEAAADVSIVDLSSTPAPEAEAERLALATAAEVFDLDRGPLLRVRLLRLGPGDHTLVAVMDHIIADGMSLGILWREMGALYSAFHAGAPSPLPPPRKQFAECVEAQRRWMQTPAYARQLAYWKEHLTGAAAGDLPADRPRPPVKSYRGGFVSRPIPAALAARLRSLQAREGVSLFTVLLAALDVLLARCSGQPDVVVMIPIACRQRFAAEEVIGFFSNMVVLRTAVPDRLGFRELLQRVGAEVMAGVLRQDVPFEKVIEAIRPDRSLAHDPLARVALSFLPASGAKLALPGVRATYAELPNGGAKFDLHVTIAELDEGLSCIAEYNSDIFEPATMAALLDHYHLLLEAAADDPDRAVADLPLLAPAERRRIVVEWNATRAAFPSEASLPDLVRAAAERTPDAPAASFEGRAMSFAELSQKSRRIARCLRARGVGPDVLVGVAVERSLDMLAGLLGILEAGGAYVPLDPAYPRERLAFMASDSGLHVLLTESRFAGLVPEPAGGLLRVDGDAAEIAAQSDAPLDLRIHPEQLAYVIYTSGSTGRPKGVQLPHRAVVNFLTSMASLPGLGPADRLLAVTSLSFDIAGLELWLPLTVGAHVEIASRETASSGEALRRTLETGRITALQATPSTFRLLLEAGWAGSKSLKVLIGGEAVPRELADRLLGHGGSVWNMYGPTETTVWSSVHRLEPGGPVLIGRPIANTQLYVLDRSLSPVPAGVTGELFIGGAGVAHGYLGRPELTAERFVPDPFASPGGRLYRTGDLCRFRADGALEFLGRADFQVKLRGHRIELGEIEAALAQHPAIREAIVIAYEESPGDQRLAAYVTSRVGDGSEAEPSAADLRAHLRARLPEYMVPAAFITLERLPLTANNKIDRKALPPPRLEAVVRGPELIPREALELKLRAIWEEVLKVKGMSLRDSFFDLGGHSLLALKLFDRIERSLAIKLPVSALFQAPTIAALGDLLRREGWQPSWSSLVPIQTAGGRLPFFCVHAVGGNVLNYRLLSRHLGDEQPFYGLQSRGLGGNEAPHGSVAEMAAAYLDEIRVVQPRGPYALGGSSSGGAVAYEMAQQLHAKGERVSLLVLMDTAIVGPPPARLAETLTASPLHRRGILLDYHLGHLLLRTPRRGVEYLVSRFRARYEGEAAPIAEVMKAATPAVRHVYESNVRALASYVPLPYPGSAVMLLSRDEPYRTYSDERLAWADLVQGGMTVRFIPGNHENMLDEPQVAGVAAALSRCLG
jgi:amino acid adenylation domain-containing protein